MLMAAMLLSGCGSNLNPLNWFGGSEEQQRPEAEQAQETVETDPRPLVDQVTEMAVERVPGGAIVRATALPDRQGYWEADLVADAPGASDNGTLVFEFRAAPPRTPTPQGTPASREITAATYLSDQALDGVRTVIVRGAQNQRSARR